MTWLFKAINIALIGVAGYFTFMFGLFYLGSEEDFNLEMKENVIQFIGLRILWSLTIAFTSIVVVLIVNYLVSKVNSNFTKERYPLKCMNYISFGFILFCALMATTLFILH